MGILTETTQNAVLASFATADDRLLIVVGVLFQEIKNSSTFENFKTYINLNIPDLFELVNSTGEYHDNKNANE